MITREQCVQLGQTGQRLRRLRTLSACVEVMRLQLPTLGARVAEPGKRTHVGEGCLKVAERCRPWHGKGGWVGEGLTRSCTVSHVVHVLHVSARLARFAHEPQAFG